MKSVRLAQIFRPIEAANRTHSQSYVEDLLTKSGQKRCAKMAVLNLSVLPSFSQRHINTLGLARILCGGRESAPPES